MPVVLDGVRFTSATPSYVLTPWIGCAVSPEPKARTDIRLLERGSDTKRK